MFIHMIYIWSNHSNILQPVVLDFKANISAILTYLIHNQNSQGNVYKPTPLPSFKSFLQLCTKRPPFNYYHRNQNLLSFIFRCICTLQLLDYKFAFRGGGRELYALWCQTISHNRSSAPPLHHLNARATEIYLCNFMLADGFIPTDDYIACPICT